MLNILISKPRIQSFTHHNAQDLRRQHASKLTHQNPDLVYRCFDSMQTRLPPAACLRNLVPMRAFTATTPVAHHHHTIQRTAHSSPNSPSTTTSLGSFANLSVLPAHFPRRTRTGNPSPICHAVNFNSRPKPRERKAPTPHSMDDPRYSTSATSNQTCAIELRILGLP
jgi:hypothetical protein